VLSEGQVEGQTKWAQAEEDFDFDDVDNFGIVNSGVELGPEVDMDNSMAPEQTSTAVSKKRTKKGKVFKERLKFYDRAFLTIKGGTGGNGKQSFMLDRFGNKLADGERGGDGSNVVLEACQHVQALRFESFHIYGHKGEDGGSKNKRGKNASELVIKVPVGTVVKKVERIEVDTTEYERKLQLLQRKKGWIEAAEEPERPKRKREISEEPLADLDNHGDRTVVCKGGQGGLGNVSFKRSYRKRPTVRTTGEKGEMGEFFLELKTLADVALVGFPNAGKSSFLRHVSQAKPKVGHWPFTTLQPHIGIVEVNDYALTQFTMADIPGLLEGASEGKGLGHHFLRHIERTKVILFMLDGSAVDMRDPVLDLNVLTNEIKQYSEKLATIPALVFLNKSDADPDLFDYNKGRVTYHSPYDVVCGSAKEGTVKSIQETITKLHRLLQKADPLKFPTYDYENIK